MTMQSENWLSGESKKFIKRLEFCLDWLLLPPFIVPLVLMADIEIPVSSVTAVASIMIMHASTDNEIHKKLQVRNCVNCN